MIKRELGKTGMHVTVLGYGSMGLRGPNTWGVRTVDEASAERMLNRVLDAGINLIDTSPDYGICEQRIGNSISHRRDEFYLATKCGCDYTQHADHIEIDHTWDIETVKRNIETSLKRLQTDRIDLLQFHGGDAETLQAAGLIDLLIEYRSQGVIQHLGVSTKLPQIEDLLALDVFETFQVPFSCLAPEHADVISRIGQSGAGVIIRGGIAHGGPDAEIDRPALFDVWHTAKLDELIEGGRSKSELILRYTISHPHCHSTIVGTCNPKHLDENIAAIERGALGDELVTEIKRRVERVKQQNESEPTK